MFDDHRNVSFNRNDFYVIPEINKRMAKSVKKSGSEAEQPKATDGNHSATDTVMEQLERAGGRLHAMFVQLPRFLKVTKNDAIGMHREIDDGSRVKSLSYWMFIVSSCGIATLGLIINSPAVIIGAMLVSPLMSPIIGLGLGIAVSDLYLGFKSLINIALSVVVAVATAVLITLVVPIQEMTPEILSRTSPTVLDLFIALFCGLVAALSAVRSMGESLLSSAAPGAAIGVALMPPLCVAGYGIGIGFDMTILTGAALLFITNLTAIVLVSSIFFYFIYESYSFKKLVQLLLNRREKSEPLFKLLSEVPAWNRLNSQISSGKRFLFPLGLLVLISYPLSVSLGILKQKNDVRNLITEELSRIEGVNLIRGADSLVYTSEGVQGSVVYSSAAVPPADFNEKMNEKIEKQFPDYRSRLSLVRVARESDLDTLRQPRAVTLESSPDTLHDAIRQQHASEIAQRAHSIIHTRFPRSAGIVLETFVTYSQTGMQSIQADYAGENLSAESLKLLEETLKKELQLLKGDFKELTIRRVRPLTQSYGCNAALSEKQTAEVLQPYLNYLQNGFLRLRIEAAEGLSLPELPAAVADRITVQKGNFRCRLQVRFAAE